LALLQRQASLAAVPGITARAARSGAARARPEPVAPVGSGLLLVVRRYIIGRPTSSQLIAAKGEVQ